MIADLLAAESLLLAILAVIYSLWYPEIAQTLDTKPQLHVEDSAGDLRHVNDIIKQRAVPLVGAGVLIALVFTPDVLRIVVAAVRHLASRGLGAIGDYDAVKTAFVLVTLLNVALSCHLAEMIKELRDLRTRLTPGGSDGRK